MIRGAVYPVDLGDAKRGHEQRGRRLGLVISIEQNAWSTATIIPTSTSAQPAVFRPDVIIAGRDTRILIDQIRTIDTAYVAGELVDYLSRDDMAQVEHSLSRYLGLLRLQPSSRACRAGYPDLVRFGVLGALAAATGGESGRPYSAWALPEGPARCRAALAAFSGNMLD